MSMNTTKQYPWDQDHEDLSFHGQMRMMAKDFESWDNVYPMEDWDLKEYKFLFYYIGTAILVQSDENCGFVFNPEHPDYEETIENFK